MDAFWIGSSTAKFVNWPATVKFVISFLSIIPLAAVSRCVARDRYIKRDSLTVDFSYAPRSFVALHPFPSIETLSYWEMPPNNSV
jgi:hypothetical protein